MIHLTQKQVADKIKYVHSYIQAENAADASKMDANANVSQKTIAALRGDLYKDFTIQINRALVQEKIAEIFPDCPGLAEQYVKDITDHVIYKNDETDLTTPYCVSVSLYPFLLDGLTKLGGESKAPKHIDSFVGSFGNLVFVIASQFSGALATPEVILYLSYFLKKAFGPDYLETHQARVDQYLQHIVYILNQPATARGGQSVFWNVSLFDKNFFDGMFSDFVFPDGTPAEWENVDRLQRYFVSWFREERKKALLTFPVVTLSAQTTTREDGSKTWKDESYLQFAAEEFAQGSEFFIYTSDTVDSLASCCFDGGEMLRFAPVSLSALDVQSEYAPIAFGSYKSLFEKYEGETIYVSDDRTGGAFDRPAKIIKTARGGRKMYAVEYMYNAGLGRLVATEDHLHVVIRDGVRVDVRSDALVPGTDFLVVNHKDTTTAEIKSVSVVESADDHVYCLEMADQKYPYFYTMDNVLTHNCRLRNAVTENQFSYSLGAGGIMTGSKSVITLNLNRIVQTGLRLEDVIDRVHKYQVAIDAIYHWVQEAGLLPVYDAGFISLDKQFLTLGISGITEAARFLGHRIDNNTEYKEWLKATLEVFRAMNKAAGEKYGVKFNTELVPGENLGVKNAKWDAKDGLKTYGDVYGSYFYLPEDRGLSVFDKMELHGGEILEHLDGGSALHWNNDERLTAAQYLKVFESLAETGSNYFCENVPKAICLDPSCGYIHPNNVDVCPKCGGDVEYATRIIGYLKRISNFSSPRQAEAGRRFYHGRDEAGLDVREDAA